MRTLQNFLYLCSVLPNKKDVLLRVKFPRTNINH